METKATTVEEVMEREKEMDTKERVIAQLYWEQQIPGKLRADLALLLWQTIAARGEEGATMDQILEDTADSELSLREKEEVKTASKINLSTRNAMRSLTNLGLVERRGHRYYELKD